MLKNKKIQLLIISLVAFLKASTVFALDEYVKLEPTAFADVTSTSNSSLAVFLGQVFNFGIAAAVTLALVMIIWGGIMYMTTDSWNGKEDGKKKITEALEGLGLALISYLIIYTINPCAVDFIGSKGCDKANTFISPIGLSTNTNNNSNPSNTVFSTQNTNNTSVNQNPAPVPAPSPKPTVK